MLSPQQRCDCAFRSRQVLFRPSSSCPRCAHCSREFAIVRSFARLLLIPSLSGFLSLFELPLYSHFAPAIFRPSRVRLLLYRFSSCSKLVYVSCGDAAFRAKAALGPLIDGFTSLIYGLVTCGVFCSENMIGRQHFEVEVQGCDARLVFQHLDIRHLVCAYDCSETLVLHCLEWIDQSASVGSFIPE